MSQIGHSVTLCTRATRPILEHAPMGEFRAIFFPNEPTAYPCDEAALEIRLHLHGLPQIHQGPYNEPNTTPQGLHSIPFIQPTCLRFSPSQETTMS